MATARAARRTIGEEMDWSSLRASESFGPIAEHLPPVIARRRGKSSRLRRGRGGARFVVQDRREPALGFTNAPAFATRIIFYLIALYLADAEITAVRMGKIQPRNG